MVLITISEALKIAGISRPALCALCRKGVIKAEKVGKKWMVDKAHIITRALLSPAEAAKSVHMGPDSIRYHIRAGSLKATKQGQRWRIKRGDFDQWWQDFTNPPHLSPAMVAKKANRQTSFIINEIKRGKLKASKNNYRWEISQKDFEQWQNGQRQR